MPASTRTVQVRASDALLGRVLQKRLTQHLGDRAEFASPDAEPKSGVVVATSPACKPDECAELVNRGLSVIVLAPVPSAKEEARYRSAGASAYLPMVINLTPLFAAVAALL